MKLHTYIEKVLLSSGKKLNEAEQQIFDHQKHSLKDKFEDTNLKLLHFMCSAAVDNEHIIIADNIFSADALKAIKNNIDPNITINILKAGQKVAIPAKARVKLFLGEWKSEYANLLTELVSIQNIQIIFFNIDAFYKDLSSSFFNHKMALHEFFGQNTTIGVIEQNKPLLKNITPSSEQFDKYEDIGENNFVHNFGKAPVRSIVSIKGQNNLVVIAAGAKAERAIFRIKGNNNIIFIGKNTLLRGKMDIDGNNNSITIGANNFFTSHATRFFAQESDLKITTGRDCLIGISLIRTSDSHSILDIDTKKRINQPKNVHLGNKVWVAQDVKIFKGVTTADNIVIGANSLVSSSLKEPNCVYAGAPAKIIRKNITWDTNRL
jgi:acetyltransferase-like isoleucine patch superfamily enzyme